MTEEKLPIRKSVLDSYLSTSTSDSSESETIMNQEGQLITMFGWLSQKCKRNWPFKYIIGKPKATKFHSRIVDRDGNFCQSNGKMAIKKKIRGEDWRALYAGDLFHSLIDAPSYRSIGILLTGYMLLVILFSIPYYHISKTYGCDMGIDSYQESFAFSLETMATIGYGTQDIFFNNCWSPIVVLACQISCKLIADAVIIGVIYSRFGRPNTRASTIIFSNHAVIRRISGKLYFMFQLVELRKHQLIEAQVRLYVIKKDIDPPPEISNHHDSEDLNQTVKGGNISKLGEKLSDHDSLLSSKSGKIKTREKSEEREITKEAITTNFQTCKMRLNYPNDELGGMLIMCLPQVVVHEIDIWSPLMPPPTWRSCKDPNKVYKWYPQVYDDLQSTYIGNNDHNHDKHDPDHKSGNYVNKINEMNTHSNISNDNQNNHLKSTSGSNGAGHGGISNESGSPSTTSRLLPLKRHRSRLMHAVKFPNIMHRTKTIFSGENLKESNENKSDIVEHSWSMKENERESIRMTPEHSDTAIAMSKNQDDDDLDGNFIEIESLKKPLLNKSRKKIDDINDIGEYSSNLSSSVSIPPMMTVQLSKREEEKIMISHYMNDRKMEVMAIVEGIDASTGGVVQARHSYVFNEIEWDRSFKPCVFEDKKDGSAIIDFSVFHDLIGVSEDALHPGSMPSHT